MHIMDFIEDVNDQLRRVLNEMDYTSPEELGLDRRAGYRVWVSEDCIVVDKNQDRTLQYYGGFEYVDKEYRIEMGDYVIYFADDDRVRDHIEHYQQDQEEEAVED